MAPTTSQRPDPRRVGIDPDFWYPLARSSELAPGTLLARRFAGRPIALMRTQSGELRAFEDRCAHRQFPLSRGVVQGEKLVCGYHAWRYDRDGSCIDIPCLAHAVSSAPRLRSYPCREASDMIFVFPGDAKRCAATPLPQIEGWKPEGPRPLFYSKEVQCHYSFMHENLMDMNHQFLHRSLMGSIKAELCHSDEGEGWVEASYSLRRESGRMHLGGGFLLGQRDADSRTGELAVISIRTEYPYQRLWVKRPGRRAPSFNMWACYVPLDEEQRSCHTIGMVMIDTPPIPGLTALLRPFMRYFSDAIFAQDREAVEAEQRAFEELGRNRNWEVFPVTLRLQDLLVSRGVASKPSARPAVGRGAPTRHAPVHGA